VLSTVPSEHQSQVQPSSHTKSLQSDP
jgi:hypothetical protein